VSRLQHVTVLTHRDHRYIYIEFTNSVSPCTRLCPHLKTPRPWVSPGIPF
jgi:hypothetical protein